MTGNLRRVLLFGAQFLPLFLVFLWLYPMVLPAYQASVLGVANRVLEQLSPALRIQADPQGGWDCLLSETGAKLFNTGRDDLTLAYLNLALLPALLLATPARTRKRLQILGWGIVLLFGLHVVWAVGLARVALCLVHDRRSTFCYLLLGILDNGGQVVAVALWGLLTWRFWFARPETRTARDA